MRQILPTAVAFSLIFGGLMAGPLNAALTTEQKKELKEIVTDLGKIGGMISKKKFDEAATAIQEAEDKITQFIKDADLKETDPILKQANVLLEKAKTQLGKVTGKGTVTFEKNVAPIIATKCLGCHADDAKGNLNLETFSGLEKGGKSGLLVSEGNAEASLLFERLVTEDENFRMPKGKEPLSKKEIIAIGTWINEGAKFTGDKNAGMSTLSKAPAAVKGGGFGGKPSAPAKKTEINKETGKETVHFMKDLMPEFIDTCGRCHNDTAKRSGFSVVSFEKLMKGGDSGAVIVPGKPEESRLWRLVNADDTPVMPAGNQTGITRQWHANLKTWILEGAKFDGTDPKKNFPSFEEREAMARASYTPEQWLELRKKAAEAEWKKTDPKNEPLRRESSELLLYGNVSSDRLEQIEKWAHEQIASLKQSFKVKDDPLWKGKLAVFVFKERFGYEEFNKSVQNRDVPREVIGHSQVNASLTDAFIALQDVGDAATETSPGMQVNLIDQLTGAFLKRGSGKLPEWLVRGTGLALANHKASGNPYLATMPRIAGGILQESKLTEPETIFVDGTFSPGEIGPIGYTMVEFLLKQGSLPKFGQLVQKLQSGTKPELAIKEVYQMDGRVLAMQFAGSLPNGGKKGKKQ